MEWIQNFQLFLFDFDGLLVNTEEIHYLAYKRMCAQRGVQLGWDFSYYCSIAHYSSEGIKEQIYSQYPELKRQEPSWEILYAEKKHAITALFNEGAVQLMPGVEELLQALQKANIKRCVVTHSPETLIKIVVGKNPVLQTIPHWITRENYTHPKPNPECYLKAIESLAKDQEKIIGFEDTPRGLKALLETRALPVMISPIYYPEIATFIQKGALYFPSFNEVCF